MKRGALIALIIGIILIIVSVFIFTNKEFFPIGNEEEIFNCGKIENPTCFIEKLNSCSPVTAILTGTDGTEIEITVLGEENGKCHFQREVEDILTLDCYFPKDDLSWDLIDQTFGNDKGLQEVVDESCS